MHINSTFGLGSMLPQCQYAAAMGPVCVLYSANVVDPIVTHKRLKQSIAGIDQLCIFACSSDVMHKPMLMAPEITPWRGVHCQRMNPSRNCTNMIAQHSCAVGVCSVQASYHNCGSGI